MKNKIIAAILCILVALGLVNVGKSLMNRFFGDSPRPHVHVHSEVQTDVRVTKHLSVGDDVILNKQFDVDQGGTLEMAIGHADVTIETSGENTASVRVTLSGRDMERAREYFESLNFEATQDGDRIIVKTEPTRRNWNWQSNGGASIDVDIVIPRRFNAELKFEHGNLHVGDLVGNFELRNAHGDVNLGSIDGEVVDVKISHGDINVGDIKARRVSFTNEHGDLTTRRVSAEALEMRSAHGDISVDVQGGRAVDILSSHGEVNLGLGAPVGGSIKNSHGNIEIVASEKLAANVLLEADQVHVGGSYSFEGSQSRTRMEGALNGGGPTLRARASFGSISVN